MGPKKPDDKPFDLWDSVRPVVLQESPWKSSHDNNLWIALGKADPGMPLVNVRFRSRLAPDFSEHDVVYCAYRNGWEAILTERRPVIARVNSSVKISPNKWKYDLLLIGFDCTGDASQLSPYIEIISGEESYVGLNMCEVENYETGKLGNGLDVSGLVPRGETNSFLSPVPEGTLVYAFLYNTDVGRLLLFQYANQRAYPFGSHLVVKTKTKIEGPEETTGLELNGEDWEGQDSPVMAKCPLLRVGESLLAGTKVIVSQNLLTGEWEIIEAQCKSASAAALPGEGEYDDEGADPEFQDDSVIVDEPSPDSPEGEE